MGHGTCTGTGESRRSHLYDVVIVGGRCAGASLAMLLARNGHRVALVDRASFPSDTMSTHFLWQRGAARLQAWGLLDGLESRGCAPIHQIAFDVGPVQLHGIGPPVGDVQCTYCPRRTVLDGLLVEAATTAGAELIDRFTVDDVVWSDGRVTGVVGHHTHDQQITLRSKFVVGADGRHSKIGRSVGAQTYQQHGSQTGVRYSYWSGLQHLGASFHARHGRLVLVWPTNDQLTCLYVGTSVDEFRATQHNVEPHFLDALSLVPGLRDAVTNAERTHRFVGTDDLPNGYRCSAGPGWALVGDAGHHKDPSTGMGMSDAFIAAEALAGAIHAGLIGVTPMDTAVAQYQQQRDNATSEGLQLALSTARMAPLSLRQEKFYLRAADNHDLSERVFGVLGGTLRAADVFASPSHAVS